QNLDVSAAFAHPTTKSSCTRSGGFRLREGAFRRTRSMGRQRRIEPVEGRAIRTYDLGIAAHVEEDVRVVEGRHGADAHELLGADFDHADAGIVMEMRDDVAGHDRSPSR